ncbi:SHOCT domain-containing protein [Dermatophilaceae bacterium Soc4.6]
MTLLMIAFWALVVGGVFALFRNGRQVTSKGESDSGPTGPSAENVLDDRFARGEIDAEEYQARRALLNATAALTTPLPSPPRRLR